MNALVAIAIIIRIQFSYFSKLEIVFALYNTRSCPLMTRRYPSIFGMNTPLHQDFRAILITTDKEADQLQNSCSSLPTVTVPVVTPHVKCGKPSASS